MCAAAWRTSGHSEYARADSIDIMRSFTDNEHDYVIEYQDYTSKYIMFHKPLQRKRQKKSIAIWLIFFFTKIETLWSCTVRTRNFPKVKDAWTDPTQTCWFLSIFKISVKSFKHKTKTKVYNLKPEILP